MPLLLIVIVRVATCPCTTEKLRAVGLGAMVALTGVTPAATTVTLME